MRHFHRCQLSPDQVLEVADRFFPSIELTPLTTAPRTRTYAGPLGSMRLSVRLEGGHYTFVQAESDQMGESRLDRNIKRFFVELRRLERPAHTLKAAY
jgi:hypothetical protein